MNKWRKHPPKQEQGESRNFPPALCGDAGVAEESTAICAILKYAGFVFGSWQAKARFRE